MLIVFLFSIRIFYFMALIDEISPLVDIIFKIFSDIKYFMLVFILTVIVFAFSFFLLGQNQLDFDDLTPNDRAKISYGTILGSLRFIFEMTLGAFDTSLFFLGNNNMGKVLYILFLTASFTQNIHLLNMLIAIMGNTFGERTEVSNLIQVRDHLKFVIDNWHMNDTSFKNKSKIKYIITAFNQDEKEVEEGPIEELRTYFQTVNAHRNDAMTKLKEEQIKTQKMLQDFKKEMNRIKK